VRRLEETISGLQERRRALIDQLADIDELFAKYGIQVQERGRPGRKPGRRPGRPPKAAAAGAKPGRRGRRKRGVFKMTAHESITGFLRSRGDRGATTGEINKHWHSEGRAGSAYVSLGQLVKQRKVKKENLKGQRGSRYTLP